jgi:hypothetical protein
MLPWLQSAVASARDIWPVAAGADEASITPATVEAIEATRNLAAKRFMVGKL